jgi:hypothetical protein
VVVPPGGWLRAELLVEGGYLVTAVTSPIFAGAELAPSEVRADPTPGPKVDYATPSSALPTSHCC